MKHFYSIRRMLASAVMLAAAGAAFAGSYLVVHFADGSTTSFVVDDKPRVTFGDDRMSIRSAEIVTDYAVADVKKFEFSDKSSDAMLEAGGQEVRYTFTDAATLRADGLRAGERVSVVSAADGRQAATFQADADGSLVIDLSPLAAGVYVVAPQYSRTIKIRH